MPFTIRPSRRFPVPCPVTYDAGPFQCQGTVCNLSCTGRRFSGDLPLRPGATLSLTVTLPNARQIVMPEAVVRWSGVWDRDGRDSETYRGLSDQYVRRLVKHSVEILHE